MTCINAYAHTDAVYFLTDTTSYDRENIVRGFVAKTMTVPHLKMMYAVSGLCTVQFELQQELKEFGSFDDVVNGFPSRLREAFEAGTFDRDPDPLRNGFRLFFGGWSDQHGCPELYALSTHEEPGIEAFELTTKDTVCSPGLSKEQMVSFYPRKGEVPVTFLTSMIDHQRRLQFGAERHVIGGHAILTRIDSMSISQTVVRRWVTDRVGERVDPDASATGDSVVHMSPQIPEGLSRLQRERMEKKARKGTLRA
jgi:hypothetical protein